MTPRRLRVALALALVLACFGVVRGQEGKQGDDGDDGVRLESDLVLVPVSVRRESGGAVGDLKAADFTLLEDGAAQEIAFFDRDEAPIDAVLLIDSSGSVEASMDVIRDAALRFVKSLRPEDSVSIVVFADRPVILLEWTGDIKAVEAALKAIKTGGSTGLYGAIVAAVHERFYERPTRNRRAAVVLTDGDDTLSSVTSRTATETALRRDASLYVVSIGRISDEYLKEIVNDRSLTPQKRAEIVAQRKRLERAEPRLVTMAEETGGQAFFPKYSGDLPKAYGEVAGEIRSRYVIGYYSAASPGYHAISVSTRQQKTLLHARQGFFKAPAAPRQPAE